MRAAHAAALLLGLTACKFPFPPDVNDDGRPSTDATGTDGPPTAPLTIAFVSDRTGNDDIFSMRLDGTDLVNLTSDPADDHSPLWSPTGDRIAFLSNRSGTTELYVMQADGSRVTNVSRGQAMAPAWAPDGSRLAFGSTRSGSAELWWGAADGSQQRQVAAGLALLANLARRRRHRASRAAHRC